MTKVPGVFAGGDAQQGPRTVGGGHPRWQDRRRLHRRLAAWHGDGQVDRQAGAPRRSYPAVDHRSRSQPSAARHDAREERRRSTRRRQLRAYRGGPYRRHGAGRGPSLPALRRVHRLRPVHGRVQRDGRRGAAHGRHTAGRLAYFDFTRPAELCIGCGACTQVCPTGAIRLEDRDGMRRTIITGTVVREQPLLTCTECGAPTQTPAHREYVRRRLPDHMAALLDRELCPSCARLRADRPRLETAGPCSMNARDSR